MGMHVGHLGLNPRSNKQTNKQTNKQSVFPFVLVGVASMGVGSRPAPTHFYKKKTDHDLALSKALLHIAINMM